MPQTRFTRFIESVRRFFEDGGFAAFSLCLLAGFEAILITLLLTPGGDQGIGALADEFRVWCFGLDPATGRMEIGYIFSMLLPPVMICVMLLLLWWKPVRQIFSRPLTFALYLLPALVVVAGAGAAFAYLATPAQDQDDFPFPAEAIRTHLNTPPLRLTNQAGDVVDLAEMRGKVVVLTGVYSCCPKTCPLLIAQAKAAIGKLSPEIIDDLRFVGVTLDPERDTPEVLAALAGLHELDLPLYNFVTGEVPEVEKALDALSIARKRDVETGVIDHANMFILVDRGGKVAYRLGLGERQARWLEAAMNVLLSEGMEERG